MSSDIQVVFLGQKGEIRQGKTKAVTSAGLMAALKKKEPPSLLGKSVWSQKQRTLYFFGYLDGKASAENQHHLPTPLEGMTFYGDILVLAASSHTSYDSPLNLKTADYETFYTNNLEGDDADADADADSDSENDAEAAAAASGLVDADDADSDGDASEGGLDSDGDVDGDAGDAGPDVGDDSSDEKSLPVEKLRVTRARKIAVIVAEEPEIDASASYESSPHRKQVIAVIDRVLKYINPPSQIEMEKIIYNGALESAGIQEIRRDWNNTAFRDVYLSLARRIIGNIDPNSYVLNKNLHLRYMTKELTMEQIVKQNYYELCPENWQEMLDRQAKRERIQLEGDFSRATDKWTCHGCKQKKCTYYELQTRSSDEPMTIFIHCLNCNKRWTQ